MIARNQTFTDMVVYLDGASLYDCTFERCTIVISGVLPATLHNPRFVNCSWRATGPAENTISFFASLYRAGAKDLIEATFERIRGKNQEKNQESSGARLSAAN